MSQAATTQYRRRITMDFETRSMSDLKAEGAYKYSLDPSTQPTCLAFKEWGKPKVYLLSFDTINKPWQKLPSSFRTMWLRWVKSRYEFSAHNAFFETCIYKNILVKRLGWPDIGFRQFRCTAAKAAACALPRSLANAGAALKLSTQKYNPGTAAMLATCKPSRQWTAWKKATAKLDSGARITTATMNKALQPEPPIFLSQKAAPETWATLYKYCKIDVLSEEKIDEVLPDLIPSEQEIWFLNQRLNWRGLRIDIPTSRKIVSIMEKETSSKLTELDSLTMGLITKPGARKSILEFLSIEGIELPDIKAKTVEDVLKDGSISDDARKLLEIRKALGKTSITKYRGFIARANDDDRVRDILLYHGAATGRDTGSGIQPHNFPKGVIKVDKNAPYAAVDAINEFDTEDLKVLYGETLSFLFSSVLRNMILPSPGSELFVADFSKIEVAVLWWIAGNEKGLEILRAGKDPYIYQAAENLGKTYEEIEAAVNANEEWAVDARQLGKAQVLGCGFGMGADRFQETAWDFYRLKLTKEQSKKAVHSYRSTNETVGDLWKLVEKAAILAVERKKIVKVKRCEFYVENNFLWIKLPSGRKLAYRDPEIVWREGPFGKQKTLQFWGVNPKTRKWAVERTWGGSLVENIVQATARDLMMPAMLRLENRGYRALLMVHDEGICEREIGKGNIKEFTDIMCEIPAWGKGLPIEAKGWKGERYRK